MSQFFDKSDFIKSAQLYLLPGRCPVNCPDIEFHNQAFKQWSALWQSVFDENGAKSQPDANIFYRQDTVVLLMNESDLVGSLFACENNIYSEVTQNIHYFNRDYIKQFCKKLKADHIFNVATYEMLIVNPKYRRKNTSISFGSIMLGLICETFKTMDSQVMIGPVRLDNGVDKMVTSFGWQLLGEKFMMHNTPVTMSALFQNKIKKDENFEVQKLIHDLWKKRIDLRTAHANKGKRQEVA